jgi:hypothetical protein
MTGQELATAVHYGAKPKIVISDNGIYGTIRTHREALPTPGSGTDLSAILPCGQNHSVCSQSPILGDDIDAGPAPLDYDGAACCMLNPAQKRCQIDDMSVLN